MTKPTFPFWARTEDAGQIVVPPSIKVDRGWNASQPAAHSYMNWHQNLVGKWVAGLHHQYADLVIGSSAQVAALEASHTVNTFDTEISNGDLVVFLAGTHTRTGSNITTTEDDVTFKGEPGAILDVGAFTFSATGLRNFFNLKVTNASAGEITVDGLGSRSVLVDTDATVLDVGAAEGIGEGSAAGVAQYTAEAFSWIVAGSERMRLTSTGLAIGLAVGAAYLHIQADTSDDDEVLQAWSENGIVAAEFALFGDFGGGGATGNGIRFGSANVGWETNILTLRGDGRLQAANLAGAGSRNVVADANGVLSAP